MSSTHMSPGKRKRSTAYARYAMSMNRRKGGATVAPTWTPWIVPVDCTRIVLQCGVVWCGVVWCGVVWCGVVWCGVVWCGVPKALLPKGNGRDVYPRAKVNGLGCVCCVRCVCICGSWAGRTISKREARMGPVYVALGQREGEAGKTWWAPPWRPSLSQELPLHPLSLRLLVQARLLQRPRHRAAQAQAGL